MTENQGEVPIVPPPVGQAAAETPRPQQRPVPPERVKLARKAWEAQNVGRTPERAELETQEMAIQMGLLPMGGGAEAITEIFTDGILQNVAREINQEVNRIGAGNPLDPEFINEQLQIVRNRRDAEPTSTNEAQKLLGILNGFRAETRQALEEGRTHFGIYLQPEDIKRLSKPDAAIQWLDDQFNTLYKLAQEGQELTSPVVTNMQTVVSEAIRYLQYHNPDILDRFQALFTIRFNLIQMRTLIGYRDIDSIKSAALRLQTHGLLQGLSMEGGRVGAMFNRLHELMEDERLKQGPTQHVTPEIANQLQEKVIKEQIELAEKGVSSFEDLRGIEGDEEIKRVKADITRAVRTAYDIFVSSQRQAVIVARGRHLTGADAYFSDPASGPLNVYNLEDLLLKKFDIYKVQEEEFVRRIKLDMAENHIRGQREKGVVLTLTKEAKEDLGRRLFRDLFAVPDFFSSSWRIKGVLNSIDERFKARYGEEEGIKKAKEFALFLRLKAPDDYVNKEDRELVWGRIAEFRPEEIIRLFRERAPDEISSLGIDYDEFKKEYGNILRELRERGFRQERQVDLSKLTLEQKALIDQVKGEGTAEKVEVLFRKMKEHIVEKGLIKLLLSDHRFEDIYARTLLVDDALLDRLEEPGDGFVPLSKKYAADQGGDALVRIWTDTGNAIKAGQALVGFIQTEDPKERMKHSLEFGEVTSQYNGQEARAKCIRYTTGTFFNLSKKDYFWEIVGLEKLPFRWAMSEIERIYGPQAQPLGRDQLRDQLDMVHINLMAALDKKAETEKSPEKIQEFKNKAEKIYRDLEKVLEVTAGDVVKRKAFQLLLYIIIIALIEGYQLGKKVAA